MAGPYCLNCGDRWDSEHQCDPKVRVGPAIDEERECVGTVTVRCGLCDNPMDSCTCSEATRACTHFFGDDCKPAHDDPGQVDTLLGVPPLSAPDVVSQDAVMEEPVIEPDGVD